MPLAFACLMSHDILTRRTWPVISAAQMLMGFVYRPRRSTCVVSAGALAVTFEAAQPMIIECRPRRAVSHATQSARKAVLSDGYCEKSWCEHCVCFLVFEHCGGTRITPVARQAGSANTSTGLSPHSLSCESAPAPSPLNESCGADRPAREHLDGSAVWKTLAIHQPCLL